MSHRYGETIADPLDPTRRPPRPHVDAEVRRQARTRCKVLVPSATPGALSTLCQNPPVNELGFCAAHFPK